MSTYLMTRNSKRKESKSESKRNTPGEFFIVLAQKMCAVHTFNACTVETGC